MQTPTTHRQVTISLDGREIEVDHLMAPLISWLWDKGARTRHSCQGSRAHRSYVAFEDGAALEAAVRAFDELGTSSRDQDLLDRIRGHVKEKWRLLGAPLDPSWEWRVMLRCREHDGSTHPAVAMPTVYFSFSDFEKVTGLIGREAREVLSSSDLM